MLQLSPANPYCYTTKELAMLLGDITVYGILKALREDRKICDVQVKYVRTGGGRGHIKIHRESFLRIQRRLFSRAN